MLAPASAPNTVPAGRSASRSSRALPTNRSRYCRDSVVGRYSDFGRARQRRPPFPTAAPDFPPMRMIADLSDLHFGRIDERVVTALLRSEEHTSELQSLMRKSYAVFRLKKKTQTSNTIKHNSTQSN